MCHPQDQLPYSDRHSIRFIDMYHNDCEIKFRTGNFTVDKEYYQLLLNRQELLRESLPRRKTMQSILITTFGLTYNEYSGIFSDTIILDDLFT